MDRRRSSLCISKGLVKIPWAVISSVHDGYTSPRRNVRLDEENDGEEEEEDDEEGEDEDDEEGEDDEEVEEENDEVEGEPSLSLDSLNSS